MNQNTVYQIKRIIRHASIGALIGAIVLPVIAITNGADEAYYLAFPGLFIGTICAATISAIYSVLRWAWVRDHR